jgi:GPH family glycoside/pentoside/hexuronide:cation symporter
MGGGGVVIGNCIILALEIIDVATLSALAIFSGILFGLCQFISKAGSGLGVGMIGLFLSFIGYSANEAQSEEALQGVRMAFFLIPAVCSLGSVAIITLYPLDAFTHRRIVRVLRWKRRKTRLS